MATLGIIGWGVVGQATGSGFGKKNKIIWNNKYKPGSTPIIELCSKSDFIFLCLPTPMKVDGSGIDLSIMNKVVDEIAPMLKDRNVPVIVKSTVVPGTTAGYAKKYPKLEFAMNPEFLTEVNAPWDFMHPDRVVIGAFNEDVANRIARLHRDVMGYKFKIFITDPTTAELVKYMSNTFMATKIIFANEMADLAEKLGVNYSEVADMVGTDPRIGKSFLKKSPFGGFGLKCFPKDTVAILGLAKKLNADLSVLQAVWKKNFKIRKVRDWEGIRGAVNNNL